MTGHTIYRTGSAWHHGAHRDYRTHDGWQWHRHNPDGTITESPEPAELARRSEPDHLRHLAARLRENPSPFNVSMVADALETLADELEQQ